nr:hypothetical protein [Tanacetum cinerariifolium]
KCIEKANQQSKDFKNQNKDLQDKYDVLINQETTLEMNNKELNGQLKELIEKNNDLLAQMKVLKDKLQVKHVVIDTHVECQTNQTVHMIMPSKDNLYNGRKGIGFENPSYFEKAKDLRPTLYDEKINFEDDYFQEIINPYFEKIDSPFQKISSLKPYVPNVILKKIIIDLEDEVVSLLEKDKENLKTIEYLKSKGFESSENAISESENQSENDCLEVEKECDNVENPKVIAPGMFKLSISQSVSPMSMSKTSCDSNNGEIKLKRKRRKRKSSKQNDKQVNNDLSHANSDFVHFLVLDTFSSVRRPSHSSIIWKKKGSSNNSNVDLSAVSLLKLNKNVKRYSRKDLLSCNNSHLGETSSAFVCNDAMTVSCKSSMGDLLDDKNFFIFDDESVRISPISKMPFRKKPCDSMIVRSKSNMNKSLPRTVHKWLPKMQPLAEPVAKWFPRVEHQIDKISKTPNSPRPIYKWVMFSSCMLCFNVSSLLFPLKCSSCGALYTGDFCCSKGNVEDKILVPKLPKNCARCARCGHPVDGPYCQGCALLRKKLKKDLVTYFKDFQNTSESSDDSTNIVNAPREPFVVKQDHGVNSSQNPPHIDECCYECGDTLDGIFCQRCTCKSCGKGAHIGYNYRPKVLIISNPEPCNQTMNNEPPQILPSFDPTCYSEKEN